MRPGIVVQLRINPSTAMSVLDVLEAAGVSSEDKSFPVCVSAALNILVETVKASGLIAEPDPYQYANRMQSYIGEASRDYRKKGKHRIPGLNPAVFAKPSTMQQVVLEQPRPELLNVQDDPESAMQQRDAFQRAATLQDKKNAAMANTPGIIWSAAEEDELKRLNVMIFGG